MSQAVVLKCMKGKLPPPAVSGNDLKWTMQGHAVIHPPNDETQGSSYDHWTATLHFAHGRLDWVDVECY